MHSHLAIIGKNGELALNPDQSLNITDKNPMFNDVEMFSQAIQLPFDKNRDLLKNMDDVNSSIRATDVENERFNIVVDGIHLRTAALKVQDGAKLDGSIDVNFDATNRTFKDMIADMRCRDVEIKDKIVVGEKIGDLTVDMNYTYQYLLWIYDADGNKYPGYEVDMKYVHFNEVYQPQALGFSYPAKCNEVSAYTHEAEPAKDSEGKAQTKTYKDPNKDAKGDITINVPSVQTSYINVSQPYPAAKYCNSRIAYAHHKIEMENGKSTGETSDEIYTSNDRNDAVQEDKSPYWVLDADRPASGLCFYVAYFLECLFNKLGVAYDMSALTNIEDFNYLTFFSTGCHTDYGNQLGSLADEETINKWLSSRGCGGQIRLNDGIPEEVKFESALYIAPGEFITWRAIGEHPRYGPSTDITRPDGSIYIFGFNRVPNTSNELWIGGEKHYRIDTQSFSAKIYEMVANSGNWPDVNVTDVIQSLENSFGVRFCYDADINKVTVRLLRDMFRDQQEPIHFKGKVLSMAKETEIIKGIRMKYSAESDPQDQRDNIRYGKRDYDTVFDYCDYPQDRTKLASYEDVSAKVDISDRNGYCDLRNGNFYRIKVNSGASTTDELRPAIFEVGAMHGVELGDCSTEADDDGYVKEFVSSFVPIQVNDVAFRGKNYAVPEDPLLVPFTDDDMEHELLIKKMLNPISTVWGAVEIIYELCLLECYDPTQTDDGDSPLQHHDWGLTIGFLRLGTSAGGVVEFERNYDGFDNSKWMVTAKNYSINSDTFDEHANFIGINPQTSFSLKPRAWKPFRYKYETVNGQQVLKISTDPKQWERESGWLIPCNDDVRNALGIITERIRSRGMCDTWMIEFFRFLLNRQKYHVEALCTAAELADIPNKWLRKWEINGRIGWMNLVNYSASVEKGLDKVEIEFYAL